MPAFVLSQQPRAATRFDVVGEYSTGDPPFVRHVALHHADRGTVHGQVDVDVVHMGPPLERTGGVKAHVLGTVPLTSGEVREIETWIAEIEDEYGRNAAGRRQQYCIHPPWRDEVDPNTGVRRYRRYSCAGFVLDAYRQVDVDLLEIDEQLLPDVDEQTLHSAYPGIPSPRSLQRFGIEGPGPWRIVLAGYVLHALDRTTQEIRRGPYRAKPGDGQF